MALGSFIFDASQGESPKTLALKRALAAQIMGAIGNKPARNANEGIGNALASIGQGISANVLGGRADDAEKTGNAAADSAWNNAFTGGGGAGSSGTASAPVAAAPSGLTAAAGAAGAAPNASAAEIRAGLIARGLPDTVADGFVTNFQDESGLNPGINEKSPLIPGSRGGFGLAQWTGPRRAALEQFAQSTGRPVGDMNTQLDFLVNELKGPESKAAQSIFSTSTPQDAAVAIARDFLRPSQSNLDRRVARYAGMPDAGAPPPLAFSGEPQGSAPQLPPGMAAPAPVQTAALSDPQTMNDASPPGAFGGAPAQPAFSPFAPEWNRAPSQFRQNAPAMAAMPLGMMSGGAFSGDDQTGSLPPQAAPQPRSPFLPSVSPPAAPAPQAPAAPQPRSPFLPPQMTPASFEEAPGTIPGGGQIPQQMAQAMPPQSIPAQAPNLPTQTPNLQAVGAQQPGQQQAGLGSPDLPTLMKLASNPFIMANPGRAATVQALIKAKIQEQDPYRNLQMQKLQSDIDKARTDAASGPGVFGTPVYGQDPKTGETVLGAIGKDGTFKRIDTGGVKLSSGVEKVDLGTQWGILDKKTGQIAGYMPKDISGAESQKAQGKAQGEARASLPTDILNAEQTVGQIDELLKNPGLDAVVGPLDQFRPSWMQGDQGRDALARYNQLKGRAFLQAYSTLKGGGQITEIEGKKAEDAMARMDRSQGEKEFRQALSDFRDAVNQGVAKLRERAGVAPQAAPGGTTRSGLKWSVE